MAGTRMCKASEQTHLYGCIAPAQSMALFFVSQLGLKQLGSQVICEWNNKGLSPLGHSQIQPTLSWMVPWWLKACEAQFGGKSPVLAVVDAFNWPLNILSKLSSNNSLVISLKAAASLHRVQTILLTYRIRILEDELKQNRGNV